MKRYPYFTSAPDAPAPLCFTVERVCRFDELDPLGVVWHGRYASYFEDARVALGAHYGIGYLDFKRHNLLAPIKQMFVDYQAPLRFDERCAISASLHWTEAARLNFSYVIRSREGEVLTTGYTVQLFLTPEGELYTARPDFYADFCERWKAGEFT